MSTNSCSSNSRDVENLRKIVTNLREKSNILEDELGALKSKQLSWDVERRRLERELEIKDDAIKDLTRDLSLSKEVESKAMKRYDRAVEYSREVEEKFHVSRLEFDEEMGKLSEFKKELEDLRYRNEGLVAEMRELEGFKEEFEGFRRRNEVLVARKGELEGLMEELRVKLREKERRVDDIVKKLKNVEVRNEGLEREMGRFEAVLREKDERIEELIRKNEGLEATQNEVLDSIEEEIKEIETEKNVKIEELEKEKAGLEREKREMMAKYKMAEDEIKKIETEKNVEIEQLKKEKAGLEREKREIMAKYKMVEERFRKFEGDVISHLSLNVSRDERFAGSKTGKIVSGIITALDAEQEKGVPTKSQVNMKGNSEADPGFVSHVNGTECSLKSVTKSEVAKRIVISEEKLSGENGATCSQKNQSPTCISLSDSDDEEISFCVSGHKRVRASSARYIQNRDGSSSDESLNHRHKMKKLECVLSEPPKHGQPIAASDSRGDHTFSAPHKQTVPTIRERKENNSRKVTTLREEGNGCKVASKNNKTDVLKYLAKCQQKRAKNVLDCVADIVCACDNDPEFCAKAICALNRNGLLCCGQKGFEKRDTDRATALAEYLVDGDPNSGKKKAAELKQRDPEGLDICRKLARAYSDKLFEMFKSNKDLLFSQLSTDLQHK